MVNSDEEGAAADAPSQRARAIRDACIPRRSLRPPAPYHPPNGSDRPCPNAGPSGRGAPRRPRAPAHRIEDYGRRRVRMREYVNSWGLSKWLV